MRRTALIAGVLALMVCVRAPAGTVHFDPPSATIMPGTQSVEFEITISANTLSIFDTVNGIVSGDLGVSLAFEYSDSFLESVTFIPPPPPCGIISCDPYWWWPTNLAHPVDFGGNRFVIPGISDGWSSPLLVGTLYVDTSRLTPGDEKQVFIDPDLESSLVGASASLIALGINQEPIAGMATITVVPEPATIGILLAGSLLMLRRKSMSCSGKRTQGSRWRGNLGLEDTTPLALAPVIRARRAGT